METNPSHKSGYVAVMGRPNVGKSTLINAILGQKIAAVSPRPQTTRRRQLGILTLPEVQIVFVDTPGVHKAKHKLGEAMNQQAQETLVDAELILFLVDASETPTEDDRLLADRVLAVNRASHTILVLNKIDLLNAAALQEREAAYRALVPDAELIPLSALRGDNRAKLVEILTARLPEGPEYFPEDQVTDLYEREIAADLIREAALVLLRDEVPHGMAVRIDEYKDRDEANAYIAATLFVERDSHKGIVIGQKGTMIKQIGAAARKEIEALTGRKVYLELNVKVQKGWRDDENSIRKFA